MMPTKAPRPARQALVPALSRLLVLPAALCAALALPPPPAGALPSAPPLPSLSFLPSSSSASLAVTAPFFVAPPAHPLGNFTVNHYNGLRITPDRVENLAIVDSAELPTLQSRAEVDTDGSGEVSDAELSAYGTARCAALAGAQRLTVNGTAVAWRVTETDFGYAEGQGGLRTSRLTCGLSAAAETRGTVGFSDGFLSDRMGWREITAVASGGVRLTRSSVPGTSVSRELRTYPDDLLADPLDQRTAELGVAPGNGPAAMALPLISSGPLGDAMAWLDRTFTGLVGTESLTAPLGLLAVLMAVALGAGHALIPGHGKTVMAAYLAGRRGRPRDALIVGATVTATHTVGVLVIGLLLSAFSVLTGESVLAWLGLASGLLIAVVGAGLLRSAWRSYRTGEPPAHGHGHGHGHLGHLGRFDHLDQGPFEHGHGHGRSGRDHGHDPAEPGDTVLEGTRVAVLEREGPEPDAGPGGETAHDSGGRRSRRGLVGLGIAGGLVPSPSALVVLLGAIGLGRTWFGVALVLAYGLGMAGTLTVTGLLLVKLAGRLDRLTAGGTGVAARLSGLAPVGTAVVVVALGLGLAVRSLTGAG
ncbi:High-affinity nickel-transporter [Streptosporangium sp. NPDC051022]|uniref:nickel/cobalt transporter n=1 Tax=Streptosporangium sp. NPDC051022 TaxID=3155752 RepID=UPI0034227F89